MGTNEISKAKLERDVRSLEDRVVDWFRDANHVRAFILLRIILQLVFIAFWPLSLVTSLMVWAFVLDKKVSMPLRVPKDVGGRDLSDYYTYRTEWKFWIFKGTSEK